MSTKDFKIVATKAILAVENKLDSQIKTSQVSGMKQSRHSVIGLVKTTNQDEEQEEYASSEFKENISSKMQQPRRQELPIASVSFEFYSRFGLSRDDVLNKDVVELIWNTHGVADAEDLKRIRSAVARRKTVHEMLVHYSVDKKTEFWSEVMIKTKEINDKLVYCCVLNVITENVYSSENEASFTAATKPLGNKYDNNNTTTVDPAKYSKLAQRRRYLKSNLTVFTRSKSMLTHATTAPSRVTMQEQLNSAKFTNINSVFIDQLMKSVAKQTSESSTISKHASASQHSSANTNTTVFTSGTTINKQRYVYQDLLPDTTTDTPDCTDAECSQCNVLKDKLNEERKKVAELRRLLAASRRNEDELKHIMKSLAEGIGQHQVASTALTS